MRTRSGLCGLVLMALVIGALLLASCSTTPSTPATSETTTISTKPYGSLVVVPETFNPGDLDPGMHGTPYTGVTTSIFDPLVEKWDGRQITPVIAERWVIAPDGKSHTFYIRKGVKFEDGSDLTGADVKFSIDRIIAPESTVAHAPDWRNKIDRVDVKDDNYTVVVYMKLPQFDLLRGFNEGLAVVPKKYIEEKGVDYFAKHPIGSGPWRLLSYEPGAHVKIEAKENHWRQVPAFKTITVLNIPEESTRVAMLRTGEVDIAKVASDSVSGLKSAGLRIADFDSGYQDVLHLFYDMENPKRYAMGDIRVRKALSLAINRSEISGQIAGGYAEPSAVYSVFKTAYFFDPNVLKPDPYDPEQAKKLLVEAGYPNGFRTKIWTVGTGDDAVFNLATAGYWRKIGVDAEIGQSNLATMRTMFAPKHVPAIWDTAYGKITQGQPGIDGFPTIFHSKGVLKNINVPRLDELIDKTVPGTLDPVEKKRFALEAALLAKNDYATLSVVHVYQLLGLGPKVGGLTLLPGMLDVGHAFTTITHAK